ncbi:MAG: hypothetical protein AB8C46_15275 [Burkholderiaceae bacterium]
MKTLSIRFPTLFRLFAFSLPIFVSCIAASASDSSRTISGVVTLDQSIQNRLADGDRLVFKLFHPENGIEKDLTYRMYRSPKFPFHFEVGPNIDMSKRTKWRSYAIEVSIDRDNNPGKVSAGEPSALSDGVIPLGASGIEFELK